MVLSQQCVQLSQFDSRHVNAQCSDLSVSCACVCVFQNCMMKIPFFFPPLISGLGASRGSLASGLRELTKGPHSFFSSPIDLGVDTISALILRIYL